MAKKLDKSIVGANDLDEDLEDLRFQTGLTEDDFERLLGVRYRDNKAHMRNIGSVKEEPIIKIESPLATNNERGCNPLTPHSFETSLDNIPTVFISEQALKDMMILVGETKTEVGWLGSVKRLGSNFLIEEIFIPQQEVSMGTTEMTVEGLAKLTRELVKRDDADEICNNLKFWGHSHVNMAVDPSRTDDDQMKKFEYNDFFIRAILNKQGEMKVWLYIYEYGMIIADVPWMVYVQPSEARANELRKIIDKNAIYKHVFFPSGGFGKGVNYGNDFSDKDSFRMPDLANM